MELINFFLTSTVVCIFVMLATGKPDPPKYVRIHVIDRTAKISWTIPSNIEGATYSRIIIKDSYGRNLYLKGSLTYKDIPFPETSFEVAILKLCSEYYVTIQFLSPYSKITTQKFWMTNNTFTAKTNQNVSLSWTTSLTDFFSVQTHSPYTDEYNIIYVVQGGIFSRNGRTKKYIINTMTKKRDVQVINITIIQVNTSDAGLYSTGTDTHVDGCCLLVVNTQPMKPTLTFHPVRPFVDDNITVICNSKMQRWPRYISSNLSYQYFGNPRGDIVYNTLTLQTLTKSDKGKQISCRASGDLGQVSSMSDTVTLDPFYGPENVVLKPAFTAINITEGTTLGPLLCTALCYPECIFRWEIIYRTDRNEVFISNKFLAVADIKQNQSGIYRCHVVHPYNKTRMRGRDIAVNVLYSPKIRELWLSDKSENYVSNPTTYSLNEDVLPKMTLRIESNPDPQLVLSSSLMSFPPLKYTKSNTNFSSKLPSLTCEDSGNFTIQAVNGIKYGDNRTINFVIRCKPRNVTVESTKIKTEVNTSEIIRMHVVSFPAPTVEWRRETEFQWTVTKDKYEYRYRIQSKVHIKSTYDFGEYGINICNRLGCNVQNIILTPKGQFISPSNVYVVCKSTTATVIWIPDLIGGFYEDFYVKYTDMEINGSSNKILYNDKYQHMVYVVDGLHPGRRYHFTVLSFSILGQLRSKTMECLTDDAYQVENWRTAGIATLVVGLAALVAASVFLIRNRLKSKNVIPKESDGYIEVQRSNPVFTEPYSTLQSQSESRPLQEPSTDTYDECGIAPDVDTYQSIEDGS